MSRYRPAPANDRPGAEQTPRILLVDDDGLARRMLGRALGNLNFEVSTAADGMEAMRMVEADPRPDLVLLDFEMPGIDGAEVCRRIRASEKSEVRDLPVIMLTAHDDEADEIGCLTAGASDFVTKPVSRAVLEARIHTQLRLRALSEEMRFQNLELARWQADHEADLLAARATQQGLIPSAPPAMPGWRVETHYQPVIQVGGDLFGWRPLGKDQWLFWVVDATGHGAAAALLTTLAALLVNHACEHAQEPGAILEFVNREFADFFHGRTFMTACCAVVCADGAIHCAGAGHPPILIRRASGTIEELPSNGTILGVRRLSSIGQMSARLDPGDSALLFSDGIFSLRTRDGARFNPQSLHAAFAQATSPRETLTQIRRWYSEQSNGDSHDDDVAAVVLTRVEFRPAS